MNEQNDNQLEKDQTELSAQRSANLEAENAELRAAVRMSEAREHLTGSLRSAGANSPELLFEAVKGEIQFDDDGSLANSAAILDLLKRKYPEQFVRDIRAVSIDGGAGRNVPPPLTREALAKMSPAEIARLDWAAVGGVLKNG
jgi:hypothetical protein